MQKLQILLRTIIARLLEQRVQQVIRRQNLKVVAVTGSVGKTTTKLAIAAVLGKKYRVLAHPGNYNSEIGLPLSIFEVDVPESLRSPLDWLRVLRTIDKKIAGQYPYNVLVLEMGADQPNDIKKFMKYITPDVGVVTAIGPAHIEQFGSIDAIAAEKMSLAQGSRAVLLNAEDARVMTEAEKLGKPVQTFGVAKGTFHWQGVARGEHLALSGRLQLSAGEVAVRTQMVGRHSLMALAAAGAVGEELGLSHEEIRDGLERFEPVPGRMRLLEGVHGSAIIDDTYNASPLAVLGALETLYELPGRHVGILGSMNELGGMSAKAHREAGRAAAKLDMLVTIGEQANKFLVAGAAEEGMKTSRIHQFMSPFEAGRFVKGELKKGDVVLAKGSQNGVFAEEAVALLLADLKNRSQLVRQSAIWQKKKQTQFKEVT